MSDWKPIETVPEQEGPYLVFGGGEMAMATRGGKYRDIRGAIYHEWRVYPASWDGDSERGGLATIDFVPTHWMPLPEPPHET